jgi:hypothetical protein
MQKMQKNAQQIVKNGVDQVDLVEVPLPETKIREKREKKLFISLFFARDLAYFRAVFLV